MKKILLMLLLGFAAVLPLRAQVKLYANCSYVALEETGNDGTYATFFGQTYAVNETVHYVFNCYNQNLGNKLYYSASYQVSGTGGAIISGNGSNAIACDPVFTSYPYDGADTSQRNYGQITGQSKIAEPGPPPGSIIASGYCANGAYQSATRYCSPIACPGSGNGSPILIDTDGKGFQLTDDKVTFDLFATGHPVLTDWTAAGSTNAFLVLPGPDGLVHGGQELFGNTDGFKNGFDKLAVYDKPDHGGNGDGEINDKDKVFPMLRLWIDANHDGISQLEELHTLPSLGVNSISLHYTEDKWTDVYGDQFRYRAKANPDHPDEVGRWLYDVFFVTICGQQ